MIPQIEALDEVDCLLAIFYFRRKVFLLAPFHFRFSLSIQLSTKKDETSKTVWIVDTLTTPYYIVVHRNSEAAKKELLRHSQQLLAIKSTNPAINHLITAHAQ